MAYDPSLGGTILFGGKDVQGFPLADTWEFVDGNWTDLTPLSSPAPMARWGAGLTYDPSVGGLVLFGGHYGGGPQTFASYFLNDTWVFNATGWHNVTRGGGPPPSIGSALVYDSEDGYLLLTVYPGLGPSPNFWTWQGGSWTNITAHVRGKFPLGPTVTVADDPWDGYVLFYGPSVGWCSTIAPLTLAYRNASFENLTPNQTISQVDSDGALDALAYDPSLGGVVMFGGEDPYCVGQPSTYIFLGGFWENVSNSLGSPPPSTPNARLVYDASWGGDLYVVSNGKSGPVEPGGFVTTWGLRTGLRATVVATSVAGPPPLVVSLAAHVGFATGAVSYEWSFGDGTPNASTSRPTHAYTSFGLFAATVRVSVSPYETASAGVLIRVLPGPSVNADWTNISQDSSPLPPANSAVEMAYDPAVRATVLLASPVSGSAPYDTTWEFQNGSWRNVTRDLGAEPTVRGSAGLVWDPDHGQLVLFGGTRRSVPINDTWTFNGSGWTQDNTSSAPPAGAASDLAYDPSAHDVLDTFVAPAAPGHTNGGTAYWALRDGNWTNITAAIVGPPPRGVNFAVSEDPTAGGILFFGGSYGGDCSRAYNGLGYTYLYANGSFRNLTDNQSVVPLDAMSAPNMLDYDPNLGGVVMFGGMDSQCEAVDGTYLFSGGVWSNLGPALHRAPAGRWDGVMAYDPSMGGELLEGGNEAPNGGLSYVFGDLWALQTGVQLRAAVTRGGGASPTTIGFSAVGRPTSPAIGYSWSFGDGSALSTLPDVNHTYTAVGNWTAVVRASGWAGGWATASFPIVVVSAFNVTATANQTVGYGALPVRFQVTVAGGLAPFVYYWALGSGLGTSTAESPTVVIENPGEYTAEVTVADSLGDTAISTVNVTVAAPLSVSLHAIGSIGVVPFTAAFDATVVGGFAPVHVGWSLGDGGSATGSGQVMHIYGSPGRYVVTVVATDGHGTNATQSWNVTAVASLRATLTVSGSSGEAGDLRTLLSAVTGGLGPLTFAYSGLPSGCASANLSVLSCRPTAAGTYTISVAVTDTLGEQANSSALLTVSSRSSSGPAFQIGWGWLAAGIAVAAIVAIGGFVVIRQRRRRT
ncbi:MAG: PKD domain-containing protein [Thermoplasmata archaeon]|nr:PKD domain-containing protein [Thermoplasmata archaeon]